MAKKKSLVDQWREKLMGKKRKGKRDSDNLIPKEILDKLPPGVKIKRIEIGPKQILRTFITLLLIFWGLSVAADLFLPKEIVQVPLSKIIEAVKEDKVKEMVVSDNEVAATLKDEDKMLISSKEPMVSMSEILQGEGIDVGKINFRVENNKGWKAFGEILSLVLTVGLPLMLIFWMFSRQAGKGGAGGMFGFGKSTAKLFIKGKQSLKFADVAGVEEAKNDLMEVVDFLKHPEKYRKMGARAPKGVLLVGPAGVGKTLLARAVAGEANVPFYSMAGSEFMEMLVGVGASVSGETPVLVREKRGVRLVPVAEVVDAYYKKGESEMMKKVKGLKTLGFDKKENKFWGTRSKKSKKLVFGGSAWKSVEAVYRHKVKEMYEVEFLGGKLETTGDHSVFVRRSGWIEAKRVDELKKGDILVNLPMKTRYWDGDLKRTLHRIKAHKFKMKLDDLWLNVWRDDEAEWKKYDYVRRNALGLKQSELGEQVGVCQMTVSNWQRDIHVPRLVSKKLVKLNLPEKVKVTKDLMWLLGIYTAEGRGSGRLEFTFGSTEKELILKTARLMKKAFGLGEPKIKATETNSIKVTYYSHHLGRFFGHYCGNGSHNKKIPEFLWDLPREYFLNFLKGWVDGDGYVYREGKLTGVSVSHRLIRELAWLSCMHGIKVGVREELMKGGRVIRTKPLPDSRAWKLIIGKTSNPFLKKKAKYPSQFKKCYIKKIVKKKFDGYVYDLCGVENEGFFGGEKPMLLHNSRARDLFSTAKKAGRAIIFIDEIDAIGRMRGGIDGGHGEREQTLNQILVEMDGFDANTTVVVLAASVVGETPIMIKEDDEVRVEGIGRLIDRYFDGEEEGEVEVKGIETLGFERKKYKHNLHRKNLYFSHSAFKKVNSVFRHKVKEIYEIKYIGGELRATGSHSVFVRSYKGLVTKAVSELKQGDVLVDVPFKVNRTNKELRKLRAHKFEENWRMELPVFDIELEEEWQGKYAYAMLAVGSQGEVAKLAGVSQGTVSNWRAGEGGEFPKNVRVTAELCRLLGYYAAEGYARWEVDFCFSIKEVDLVEDLIRLVKEIFGIEPDRIGRQTPGAVNIIYSATPLAKFLIKQVGKGASHKHIPPFLFEAPKEYFVEFLRGLWEGDGHQDKRGKGEITSVSQSLIVELNWLARMHGIKTYMGGFVAKEGRRINRGKPLSAVQAYRLGWGKAANPFEDFEMEKNYPSKRAVVTEVKKVPFEGFVYDLCGVENEAFFGGESPVLLHNTNRGDLLDPALLRPGRFDRRVVLEMPDIEDRKGILAIHAKGKPFVKALDWEAVARRTVGFSGADLENMLNEAAIKAARENKTEIAMEDVEDAALKVKLGAEKRRKQTEEDRLMTAYHEAGHAIVNFVEGLDPVHRISIVSRGMALGYTLIPPKQDRVHETRSRLIKQMAMAMGGRAAEDLVFSDLTTGAAADISHATGLARNMVVEWGMSSLGPVNMGPQIDVDNFGKAYFEPSSISDRMLARVDDEIGKLVNEAFERAKRVLAANKKKLEKVAKVLVEKESLDEKEFAELMK